MLGGESEEGGDPERDPGGDRLRLNPEADPGHDHDQTGGDIGVEQVVAQPPLEHEHNLQTREVTCSQDTSYKVFMISPFVINNFFANKAEGVYKKYKHIFMNII